MNHKPPVIIIQGPTAVGKSKIAMQLATHFNSEIISCDSRQIYKYLNIGTAKPTHEEMLKIKHHLIDIIEPNQSYSAGHFVNDASEIIAMLHSKSKIPIICGGTGLYIKALTHGIANIPETKQEIKIELQALADNMGCNYMHDKLMKVDPKAASNIEVNDVKKTLRALEVFHSTGNPISYYWDIQENNIDFTPINIMITMDRSELYNRINKRIDKMLEQGLLKEIETLFAKGFKESDPGMLSVGYREFYPYFRDKKKLTESVELAKKHSRNYAKRQFTWYRKIDFDLTLSSNNINISAITDLSANIENIIKESK